MNQPGMGMMAEGMPQKRLKTEDIIGHRDINENKENNLYSKLPLRGAMTSTIKGIHIPDLSLEEGAILIENWKKTNFSEFNSWLENACA